MGGFDPYLSHNNSYWDYLNELHKLKWCWLFRQAEAKDRVLNDNNVNANVVLSSRDKDANQVEMSPKKRKVHLVCVCVWLSGVCVAILFI